MCWGTYLTLTSFKRDGEGREGGRDAETNAVEKDAVVVILGRKNSYHKKRVEC